MQIDTSSPVLVTGATGYVAGWIVKQLLEAGLTVHAPVRDPDAASKIQHLLDIAQASQGSIKFFKADLLKDGSYAEAMKGCSVVFHTASPFTVHVKDPQKELIDPAVNGTRNVLEQASQTESVKRVVLTSSCAAIYADAVDCAAAPNGILTEDVWNTTASLDHQPYSYSKTLAERAAWDIAKTQSNWDLVVLNPSLVIGPALNSNPTSESFSIVKQLGDGTLKAGAPRAGFGVVDVRDLAQAHVAAAFTPETEGRHIISGHNTDLLELGLALRDKFASDYPLPRRALPKWLVWLVAPMSGLPRKFVSLNVNVAWKADNSKGKRVFGLRYRPLKDSMEDMFQQLVDRGVFKKS
ncbi:aldehyde reductase [Shimia thalassica]|uniref:SDR family oxidoreductase n=1 Tax=Shimia thalassica TaxID=1715693 RepID=UPI0026E461DF|nr:aldehyde reductase [Shimia thalassica]MDO6521477.1 aldehyde reductase [Shimia thalassica]